MSAAYKIKYLSKDNDYFVFEYSIFDEYGFSRIFYCYLDDSYFIQNGFKNNHSYIEADLLFNFKQTTHDDLVNKLLECFNPNFNEIARSEKVWLSYDDVLKALTIQNTTEIRPKLPGLSEVPIDLINISNYLGIKLIKKANIDYQGSFYFETETFIPVIEYNGKDAEVRQRFTIAHELGHYFLGHSNRYRDTSITNVYSREEVSANKFAAELLMPKEKIKYYMEQAIVTDMNKLAQIFNVSLQSLLIRLEGLGYGSK